MKNRRILIVDDEQQLAATLAQSLRRISGGGFTVDVCGSVPEAVQLLTTNQFELVITDQCLPGPSGLELLSILRQQRPTTRTILITGFGSAQVEATARQFAAGYLLKPFRLPMLLQLVQETLKEVANGSGEPLAPLRRTSSLTAQMLPLAELPKRAEAISQQIKAHMLLAVNADGDVIYAHGHAPELEILATLAAGNLATTREITRLGAISSDGAVTQTLIIENKEGCVVLCSCPTGLIFGAAFKDKNMVGLARVEMRKLAEVDWQASETDKWLFQPSPLKQKLLEVLDRIEARAN